MIKNGYAYFPFQPIHIYVLSLKNNYFTIQYHINHYQNIKTNSDNILLSPNNIAMNNVNNI